MLIPSGGGVFEVKVGDRLVWSKKQTRSFPEYGLIVESLGPRGPRQASPNPAAS